MDTLVLMENMLENVEIRESLKSHAERIYLRILNVSIKWKVGQPQVKIRKAGIIMMIKMIDFEIIDETGLLSCIK